MSSKSFELAAGRPFAAVAVVEGLETRDGDFNRIIEEGSVFPDQVPFPLLYSHDGDEVIGRVDRFYTLSEASPEVTDRAVLESPDILQFDPLNVWVAEGYFASTVKAVEVQDLLEKRMLRGVSVGAGNASVSDERDDALVFNQFQVIELSVTSTQAIGPAMAWMSDIEFVSVPEREKELAFFSGDLNGFPVRPSQSYFELEDASSFPTVSDDGKYVAYLGKFGVAHRGVSGKSVMMPTDDDFSEYHLGNVRLDDGTRVGTGVVTIGAEHSDVRLSGAEVRKRYEDTGTVAVDVVLHQVADGVVAVGAVRPTVSAAQIRELEAAPLSGEWRLCDDFKIRLFATLAVNTPGFVVKEDASHVQSFGVAVTETLGVQGYFHDEKVLNSLEDDLLAEVHDVADRRVNFVADMMELEDQKVEESETQKQIDGLKLELLKLKMGLGHNKGR